MKKSPLFLLFLSLFLFLKASAFDTWWHAECTRKAMTGNGFSSDARLATQFSNYLTDFFPAYAEGNSRLKNLGLNITLPSEDSYEFMHFDAIFTTADIEANWKFLFENTVRTLNKYASGSSVKAGYHLPVLFNIIGASLHIVQDFYSHSNWVNIYAVKNIAAIPYWYETTLEERKKLDLYTGAYPDGSVKGKKNHADLNKDCSQRLLNKEAVAVAERASIDWVKRLMDSASAVPWSALKSYNIQNDMILKKFLVNQDATFLTTTSILNDHFDGPKPVKFVFAADKSLEREKNMAKQAVAGVAGAYASQMGVAGNMYGLPTPFWAGHKGYLITRDLAIGLKHNGRTYLKPFKNQ